MRTIRRSVPACYPSPPFFLSPLPRPPLWVFYFILTVLSYLQQVIALFDKVVDEITGAVASGALSSKIAENGLEAQVSNPFFFRLALPPLPLLRYAVSTCSSPCSPCSLLS